MPRLLTTRPKAGKNPALNSPTMWCHSGLRWLPSTGAIFLLTPLCCGMPWMSNIDVCALDAAPVKERSKSAYQAFFLNFCLTEDHTRKGPVFLQFATVRHGDSTCKWTPEHVEEWFALYAAVERDKRSEDHPRLSWRSRETNATCQNQKMSFATQAVFCGPSESVRDWFRAEPDAIGCIRTRRHDVRPAVSIEIGEG
jgi:hypothetical protein